ncbi:MAG TPA: ATP-binding protein [Vicinamibacterales bacterium]|jgi:C4-dicarboxylate-specific signal transduction histidine kinase
MRSFWSLSLQRQLAIAIGLLLVPVVAAAIWSGMSTFRERAIELGDQTRLVAYTTAAYINRDLTYLDGTGTSLAVNPSVQTLNRAVSEDLFRRITVGHPEVACIDLVRRSGDVVARAMATSPAELQEPTRDWADAVFRSGERSMSPLYVAPSGMHYVVLGYPVRDDARQVVGALGFFIDLKMIQGTFGALPIPKGSVVTVADRDGRILARSQDANRYVGQLQPVEMRPAAEIRDPAERTGIDGVRRMYGEALVDNGPWVVSVGLPMSLAFNRAASLWARSFAILAFGLAGWLIVAFGLSRRLANSLAHLETAAQRIGAGDFRPVERRPMPTREFAELQDAFDLMLRRFNDTRTALDGQMGEERRMREELQSLQRQVIRQERLAAVGQLVSGVAHEINNPLQAILGFAELLQMQADVSESVKADLRLIQKESARACNIIRNLAMFARQQPGEAAPMRLTDVIGSVAELRQRRLASEQIELRIEDSSTQYVSAVLTELQQVVLNFVVNAEQAIRASGRLPGRITIRSRDNAGRVTLEVEDTGPGIATDNEAKLFQPFFTTKPVGQGTGLGLSISYGIIDSLGGRIGYRRAPAGGAVFYFDLPAASAEAA